MAQERESDGLLASELDDENTLSNARAFRSKRLSRLAAAALTLGAAAGLCAGFGRAVFPASAGADLLGASESHGSDDRALVNEEQEEEEEDKPPCLCVFDIDRTMTGKQGWAGDCPMNEEKDGMFDTAYAKGTLLLSELGSKGLGSTFCSKCFSGITTAGMATGEGSDERKMVLKALGSTNQTRTDWWQDVKFQSQAEVKSSLVCQAVDGHKQDSVRNMISWWKDTQSIEFADENVWFFDDIKENVQPFDGTGFNAVQISCGSRGPSEYAGSYDGKIGGCGARLEEIKPLKGIHICE